MEAAQVELNTGWTDNSDHLLSAHCVLCTMLSFILVNSEEGTVIPFAL
jgi:hypothetical protein